MRSRRTRPQGLPEVNLVPMLDVLMTVLTFFIIISMTLTGQQIPNVSLPMGGDASEATETNPDAEPLVIGLTNQGQLMIDSQQVSSSEMTQLAQTYLAQHPEGTVILKADESLPYRDVLIVLRSLRDIGGDRVGMATQAP